MTWIAVALITVLTLLLFAEAFVESRHTGHGPVPPEGRAAYRRLGVGNH